MTAQETISGVKGFSVAGVCAGLKGTDALDFALVVSDRPCAAAGVFTTNLAKAAPVLLDRETLADHAAAIRAVAVNTKCANACTGEVGLANAREMAKQTADALKIAPESVLVMSTGVIGTHLPMDKIARGVELASAGLGQDWAATARAIMTTDTRPKSASVTVQAAGGSFTIAGIAKGAGMIAPNMATMLSAIVTDAALNPDALNAALHAAVETTFNRVVVDGDMSTNDTVLLLANGASGFEPTVSAFTEALREVCDSLARQIARDGEGATKFVQVEIIGAPTDESAHQIANAIATSPLTKTALYGGDANWGRIIAAAGRAGVPVDPNRMTLWVHGPDSTAPLCLFSAGLPADYSEEEATAIMKGAEIAIALDCAAGSGASTVYTCDLSHDYVSINGHYRS
ncbi:MAG: bifunctional glutamate N-acetyltransferase/amino-acid acetyltransferase ArgJ [Anaerolineae bacterium]